MITIFFILIIFPENVFNTKKINLLYNYYRDQHFFVKIKNYLTV